MRCENCKIEVKNLTDNCPLCGKHLVGDIEKRETCYPNLEDLRGNAYNKNLRLLLFLIITSSIIVLTVNLLTYRDYFWSIIPISAAWLVLPTLGIPYIKKNITPLMILLDNVVISIFLVILNQTVDETEWAMSYAVPLFLFGSALTVTVIVLLKKMTYRELYLFQLSLAAICFIPIILRAYFNFVFWPSAVTAVYGVITFIAMLIFSDKNFKYETKKRFHL